MTDNIFVESSTSLKDDYPVGLSGCTYQEYYNEVRIEVRLKSNIDICVVPVVILFKEEIKIVKINVINLEQKGKEVTFELKIEYVYTAVRLTTDWIISTLKKSGCNSKQVVIDRLSNLTDNDAKNLRDDLYKKIIDGPIKRIEVK